MVNDGKPGVQGFDPQPHELIDVLYNGNYTCKHSANICNIYVYIYLHIRHEYILMKGTFTDNSYAFPTDLLPALRFTEVT